MRRGAQRRSGRFGRSWFRSRRALYGAIVLVSIGFAGWLEWRSDQVPERLQGVATVIDGDTLKVRGRTIRLTGMDAPERGQRCRNGDDCGRLASDQLASMVRGRKIFCEIEGTDRYERLLSDCRTGSFGGDSLSRAMLKSGWADIDVRYPFSHMEELRAAKNAKRGLYGRGGILAPHEHRAESQRESLWDNLRKRLSDSLRKMEN